MPIIIRSIVSTFKLAKSLKDIKMIRGVDTFFLNDELKLLVSLLNDLGVGGVGRVSVVV